MHGSLPVSHAAVQDQFKQKAIVASSCSDRGWLRIMLPALQHDSHRKAITKISDSEKADLRSCNLYTSINDCETRSQLAYPALADRR